LFCRGGPQRSAESDKWAIA